MTSYYGNIENMFWQFLGASTKKVGISESSKFWQIKFDLARRLRTFIRVTFWLNYFVILVLEKVILR